jgi:hypothetical protein
LLAEALRLRANLIEVAISGRLVLGVGSLAVEAPADERIAEQLTHAVVPLPRPRRPGWATRA